MDTSRGVVAVAVFVIALAGIQLSLNVASGGSGDDGTLTPVSRLSSQRSNVERGDHERAGPVTEDSPLWRCDKMGNRQCGPDETAVFPTDADPRPLRMVGVEIHSKKCPTGKGANARVKLLKRSAIYGHCWHGEPAKDEGPTEPREPSTSRGKK